MPRINVGLTCCICLNQGRLPNEWVTLIMCGHIFHDACVRKWTETRVPGTRYKFDHCPTCRTPIQRLPIPKDKPLNAKGRPAKAREQTRFRKLMFQEDSYSVLESSSPPPPRAPSQNSSNNSHQALQPGAASRTRNRLILVESSSEADDDVDLHRPGITMDAVLAMARAGRAPRAGVTGESNANNATAQDVSGTESESDQENARPARIAQRGAHLARFSGAEPPLVGDHIVEAATTNTLSRDSDGNPDVEGRGGGGGRHENEDEDGTPPPPTTTELANEVLRLNGVVRRLRESLSEREGGLGRAEESRRATMDELGKAREDLQESQASLAAFEERVATVEREKRSLAEENKELREAKKRLKITLAKEVQHQGDARAQIARMTKEINTLQETNERLKEALEAKTREAQETKEASEERDNQNQERFNKERRIRQTLEAAHLVAVKKLDRKRERCQELESELVATIARADAMASKLRDPKGKGKAKEGDHPLDVNDGLPSGRRSAASSTSSATPFKRRLAFSRGDEHDGDDDDDDDEHRHPESQEHDETLQITEVPEEASQMGSQSADASADFDDLDVGYGLEGSGRGRQGSSGATRAMGRTSAASASSSTSSAKLWSRNVSTSSTTSSSWSLLRDPLRDWSNSVSTRKDTNGGSNNNSRIGIGADDAKDHRTSQAGQVDGKELRPATKWADLAIAGTVRGVAVVGGAKKKAKMSFD